MVNPTQSNVRATDLHRVFLQSLLSRRVETEHVMVELYKRAVSACQGEFRRSCIALEQKRESTADTFKRWMTISDPRTMPVNPAPRRFSKTSTRF